MSAVRQPPRAVMGPNKPLLPKCACCIEGQSLGNRSSPRGSRLWALLSDRELGRPFPRRSRHEGGVNGKACLGRVGGDRGRHSAGRVRRHELPVRVQSRQDRFGWSDLRYGLGRRGLLQGADPVFLLCRAAQPDVVASLRCGSRLDGRRRLLDDLRSGPRRAQPARHHRPARRRGRRLQGPARRLQARPGAAGLDTRASAGRNRCCRGQRAQGPALLGR